MSDAIPAVDKPDHIPESAVYDFDMFLDDSLLTDPHERVRQMLRDLPSVFWTPRNFGHWVAIGHEEVFEAARNTENFSNEYMPADVIAMIEAMQPPGTRRTPQQKPIAMDPPDHGKYRAPLQRAFSPKAIAARTEEVRTLANSLIDAVIDQGHCDFIAAIAEPLPVQIFMRMMGLPIERLAEFRRLVHEFVAPGMTNPMEIFRRQRLIADAMNDVILARKDNPKDDLISLLWSTEIDGKPMDIDLMEDYCNLLFVAGLDTVINGMGYGIRHLANDQATQQALRANPKLIPEALDEVLRRYTFTIPPRRAAKDVVLGGQSIKAGEFIMLYLPAADLDPHVFKSPEIFDLNREQKTHIAFGAGPHRCLGSHLARLELEVLYTEVLQRLPTFRLDADKPVKFRGGNILAIDSLPIRWD
jgi:cytochrome P450